MALDDVRTVGEKVDGQNKGEGSEEQKEKSFTDNVLETLSSLGTSVRGLCVETGNTLKGCVYPVKENVVKCYDSVVKNFKTKGTRNNHSYKNVSRLKVRQKATDDFARTEDQNIWQGDGHGLGQPGLERVPPFA